MNQIYILMLTELPSIFRASYIISCIWKNLEIILKIILCSLCSLFDITMCFIMDQGTRNAYCLRIFEGAIVYGIK